MKERSYGHEPRETKHGAFIAEVKTLDCVNPIYLRFNAVIYHVMYIMAQLNIKVRLFNMPTTFTAENVTNDQLPPTPYALLLCCSFMREHDCPVLF